MSSERQDPDMLLKQIKDSEKRKKQGKLKIFFGYAAGVGKTYAMLCAAHYAKEKGIDVVAGYIEPHARPETRKLMDGLECLETKKINKGGLELREFDIDAAIKRKPELILVDELAHTNAPLSRHEKRYQDVQELLRNGINVYTTVNVQHIESINDDVSSITGINVRERIPDSVFDSADEVEIIDIEPKELIERLKSGKVYRHEQAQRAVNNFFNIENLTALREIALRRCADQVNNFSKNSGIKQHDDYHTEENILVCLSSSPSNAKIIRTAARMANAFKGTFTAVFVETTGFREMSEDNIKRLRENMNLARQLGAEIETVYGDDIAFQISEFARQSGISKIVLGRSAAVKGKLFKKKSLVEKLIEYAPYVDIHVIPDAINSKPYITGFSYKKHNEAPYDILICIAILTIVSIIGIVFRKFGIGEANIILFYVLGVLLISVATKKRIYSLISSVIGVLVFNFLFTEPFYSLKAYDPGYPVTFFIMFLTGFIASSLAVKLKNSAKQSALVAYRTKVLLDTSQSLQKAKNKDEIMSVAAHQIIKLIRKDVVTYLVEGGKLREAKVYFADENTSTDVYTTDNEKTVALWVLKNNKQAGATTKTLSDAKCLYLALRVKQNVYGVIGIALDKDEPDSFEKSIMLSILGECALALENDKNASEKETAAVLAKNEQLRANLLRSISHDLRTPLTSISGNASNLLSNSNSFDEETKKQLYEDIYDDSAWLINLVENLLTVTRIEEGRIDLRTTDDIIDDAVEEALRHINRKSAEHKIRFLKNDDILLAKMDARLIVQVIINIVDNAIKYTQKGSCITIKSEKKNNMVYVSVADDGEGISDDMKEHIFDMFYSGANKIADSRRSLGLGLSLCKSIINAHGGEISVSDNKPHGTIFTFTLPAGEVKIYE